MKGAALVLLCGLALGSGAVLAEGDAAAGKAKSGTCAACHGADGNSTNPQWPSLAGQHESYLADQIRTFKEAKERENVLMAPMVNALSEEDIDDVAAYYASLPRRGLIAERAKQALLEQGERLYRAGDLERGIPACTACHGPTGDGLALAGFPKVSAQHAEYTAMQLKAFRDGARTSDPQGMMRDSVERLTDAEIESLAEYLAGLH